MVVVPQLLQLVLASLHVVLCQTLQTFLLGLHHLADVSWEDKQICDTVLIKHEETPLLFCKPFHTFFGQNAEICCVVLTHEQSNRDRR